MNSNVEAMPLRSQQIRADALMLLVSLVWGSTFVLTKQSVAGFPVFAFLSLRFGLATVVLCLAFGQRLRSLSRRTITAGVVIGVVLFAGLALQTIGLRYTTASKSAFIASMSVVIVPILSAAVLRDPPARPAVVGILLATLGLALLTLPVGNLGESTGAWLGWQRGDLITFGCAICFAVQIVCVSVFAQQTDAMSLTIIQVAVAALLSALAAGLVEGWPSSVPADVGLAAAFTGVMATALAFAVQNGVQAWTSATRTALILTTEPVFAALLGYVMVGERLTPPALAGCGLILLGMLLAEVRPAAHPQRAYFEGRRELEA
jgi:drug/metabolite transporter (DMT)-like permease